MSGPFPYQPIQYDEEQTLLFAAKVKRQERELWEIGSRRPTNYASGTNKGVASFWMGAAVARDPSGSGFILANNSALATAAIGLATLGAPGGKPEIVQMSGLFTLDDWTPVTGAKDLVSLAYYWLDATSGKLTTVMPVGPAIAELVGFSVSPRTLQIEIEQLAALGIGSGGGGATASVLFSAGTLSSKRTDITFSNSNGVSFGLSNNGVITATVATNYQSQGAYLTTAMASNRGSDFVQATAAFAGTNASGTINSTGISVSVAAQSAQSINISAGTTSNNLTAVTFSNSNNVSFGLNASTITASIATTYAGTGFTTATTAGTNVVGTLNTSGLSLGVPAYLTTVAAGTFAGTNTSVATTAGSDLTLGVNTSGVTIGYPKWLTTAMASNAATISNINISAGGTSTNASAFTFSNSNNFTFGLGTGTAAGIITASYTVPPVTNSSLTLSDAATSLTIGRLAFTNSNGLTLTLSTTTGGSATLIGSYTVPTVTNSSWTVSDNATSGTVGRLAFTNVNGVTLSLSSGTGGLHTIVGSVATSLTNINVSAGAASNNLSAVVFSNSNNVSFGLSGSTITGSVASTYAGTGFTTTTTAGTAVVGTLNTSGLSLGVPAFITTPPVTGSYWCNMHDINGFGTGLSQVTQVSGSSIFLNPFFLPYAISANYVRLMYLMSDSNSGTGGTTQANTSFRVGCYSTLAMVFYSQGTGGSSRSLMSVTSTSVGITGSTIYTAGANGSQYTITLQKSYPVSGTTSQYTTSYAVSSGSIVISSNSNTLFTGHRFIDVPFAESLNAGNYWIGLGGSSSSNSNSANISFAGTCTMSTQQDCLFGNIGNIAPIGAGTSASDNQYFIGMGCWTTNSLLISTAAIGINSISVLSAQPTIPIQFIRQA